MKKLITLGVVFSVLFLSVSLMAKEKNKGEVVLGAIGFMVDGGPHFSAGMVLISYKEKVVGLEGGLFVAKGGAIISGNFILNPSPESLITPFITGGICTTTSGDFLIDGGIGLKIRLTNNLGIRTEYRYFTLPGCLGCGIGTFAGGIAIHY